MRPLVFSAVLSGAFFGKYFGERNTLVTELLFTALTCVVIPFISNLSLLYVSQAVGGFARGLVLPLLRGLSIKKFQGISDQPPRVYFRQYMGLECLVDQCWRAY